MPSYVRAREGNTYFFTVVTYRREPILCKENFRNALRQSIKDVRTKYPFDVKAWVLLPDHLHCIWELPEGDIDFSTRWALVKSGVTKRVRSIMHLEEPNASRVNKSEQTIWQRRFWEHCIRNDGDFKAHCDYIHYNPVKHGLVGRVSDWEYSTFHNYVEDGIYDVSWGDGGVDFPGNVGSE